MAGQYPPGWAGLDARSRPGGGRRRPHLAQVGNGGQQVTLRVLPIDALVDGYTVPRCAFSVYTYPDRGDPVVVAIDTVTSDLVLTDPVEVRPYEQLYNRLRDAALPVKEGLDLLGKAAAELSDQ